MDRAEVYIAKLGDYSTLGSPLDDYQQQSWDKVTEGLKTALATQSNTFVTEFMDAGGLEGLMKFLDKMDEEMRHTSVHTNLVACVKALMNNSVSNY